MEAVLDGDRRLNVRLIAEEAGLPKTDVHRIVTEDLRMRKTCAKLVPKECVRCVGIFGLKIMSQRFPTHRIALTWLRAISFYSPSPKPLLKGHHFGTVENVQAAATRALNNISSEDYLHCCEECKQRWNRCIRSQGAYFEGDKL